MEDLILTVKATEPFRDDILPVKPVKMKGYDFNNGTDYHQLLQSFRNTGFQATNFGMAVEEINKMINAKLECVVPNSDEEKYINPYGRDIDNCTIFLGFTSNMMSCGVRETIRYLVQHNMVDCIVATAGGIEEDFIKCFDSFYMGDFQLKGGKLRDLGLNRTGNLLVPDQHYEQFERWLLPILDQMLEEQRNKGTLWTPSKFIARLGKEINNPESVYYWCYKNKIPVFSPALTDGAIGDTLYIHKHRNPGLIIDIIDDVYMMNSQARFAKKSGMIILGGGLCKHHICNANYVRGGADFSVYVNTAHEFDGSDSGASPDEAVSWGKIKNSATPVKVHGEASIIFPLLVAETFSRNSKDIANNRNHLNGVPTMPTNPKDVDSKEIAKNQECLNELATSSTKCNVTPSN